MDIKWIAEIDLHLRYLTACLHGQTVGAIGRLDATMQPVAATFCIDSCIVTQAKQRPVKVFPSISRKPHG